MKNIVKEGLTGLSGRIDDSIYYYHPRLRKTIVRRAPIMPLQSQNIEYRNISRQIKELKPSDAYKNDFKVYLMKLRDADESVRLPSWYSLYIKMLWAMQAKYPQQVDLRQITREQVMQESLPCRSVKEAVEDGLLAPLAGYQYLNNEI